MYGTLQPLFLKFAKYNRENKCNIAKVMSTTTLTTKPGTNLIQEEMEYCIAEIQAIETELNAQFEVLGEQIDTGFKQIGELTKHGIQVAKSIGRTFDSEYAAIGTTAMVFAGAAVFGAIEKMNAARVHNAALDKMLKLKKKLASEKLAKTEKLAERATKVQERIGQLVEVEAEKTYAKEDVENPLFKLQLANMQRIMNIYRLSSYSKILVDFLCSEYRAWNIGKHCSSKNRPTYFDANSMIAKRLCPNHNMECELSRLEKNKNLLGADVFIVTDIALLSPILCKYGFDSNNYDDEDEYSADIMKSLPKIQSLCARKLLKKNAAYKTYKRHMFWFKYGQTTIFLGITILLLSLVFFLLSWLDWRAWIEWTLGIIFSLCACFISGYISYGNEMPKSIAEKAHKKLKKQAGYVKISRPDFSKKNVVWAGFTGAIKGAISSFSD